MQYRVIPSTQKSEVQPKTEQYLTTKLQLRLFYYVSCDVNDWLPLPSLHLAWIKHLRSRAEQNSVGDLYLIVGIRKRQSYNDRNDKLRIHNDRSDLQRAFNSRFNWALSVV